jgi:hypothetical protein
MDFVYTALLFLILMISAAAGWAAQHKLRDRHIPREAVDSIRLLMGMLLTFAALVLGLLTSSAKQRFDGYDNDLSAYAADLIELDHRLKLYGPDANQIHALLRSYTAAAIADTWPGEAQPSGPFPHFQHPASEPDNIEGTALGQMLANVDVAIEHLAPPDDFHRQIAERLRNRVALAIQQRWRLILSAHSTISWPLLLVLTTWLAIIFAIFGLTSPRSRLIYTVVVLSALSIASPLYLILDYSDALTGLLQISSFPMRVALSHMDSPD